MIIEHDRMQVIVSNDYQSMEQKNTIFIRGVWDPEIIPFRKIFDERHYNLVPPSGMEGFTNLERALRAAAWSVCQEYAAKNEFGCANGGFYAWHGEKNPRQVTFNDEKEASLIVKDAARFLGASLVGIAEFNPGWVYSSWYDFSSGKSVPAGFPFKVRRVISLALESDYSACLTSPTLISCAATGRSYSGMAEIAVKLATFIRLLGYEAIPCGNDTALSIPIAVQAGLGEVGRNGILITPQFGPRVRLLEIFTDMPLQIDKPITFGVSQFCIKCRKCAQFCPADAIPMDPKPTQNGPSISNSPGVLKWYTDPEKCYKFWAANGGECNNCIACCPYNKWSSWHHGLTKGFADSIHRKALFSMTASANHPARLIDTGPAALSSVPGALNLSPAACEQKGGQVAYALCKASWVIHDYTSFYQWQLHPSKFKTDCGDPAETAVIIKRAARFLGADLAGVTKTRTPAGFPFEVKSVIVMAIEMDYEAYRSEPSLLAAAAAGLGYSRMAETAGKLAVFIKELGYRAVPCDDDIAPSIPLAIKAGLGESGRNGLLITRQYGARVRLCKIFTDLEIKTDQPQLFGVKNICASCRVCADACPVQAISKAGPEECAVDAARCARFCEDNATDCCRCIVSCPLNKPAAWETDLNQSLADINLVSPFQPGVGAPRNKQRNIRSWWNK
jgi:epoxyqueuosine reductase QueG